MVSQRASCWSITINNPEEVDYKVSLPAGWKLMGQLEQGEQGTVHYQGMLNTPQVRFTAVKKVFPRAHIEIARNQSALAKYVRKEDTRIAVVSDNISTIPTLWDYQRMIANNWKQDEFIANTLVWLEHYPKERFSDYALRYVDLLVSRDIETNLTRGVEFIAINPMWRSSWKNFYASIIKRRDAEVQQAETQAGSASSSSGDET